MRAALALLAAAILSACAASPFEERIVRGFGHARITGAQFSGFAAAPLVEIHGARPGGASDAAIAAELRLPAPYRGAAFRVVEPGPEARRAARIVLNFGAGGAQEPMGLCAGRVAPGVPAPGLEATAVFCRGLTPGASARLTHARPLEPGDAAFQASMGRLLAEISPRPTQTTGLRDN
jgi:hypothetical protein